MTSRPCDRGDLCDHQAEHQELADLRARVERLQGKSAKRPEEYGRLGGRPRRVTPEILERVRELREGGTKWAQIAIAVKLPSGTCRRLGTLLRVTEPRAQKAPPEF